MKEIEFRKITEHGKKNSTYQTKQTVKAKRQLKALIEFVPFQLSQNNWDKSEN